jgi:hypothetical protein
MDKSEQIVPARFDYQDAVAGLRAIEESGHVAGDLGQAADAASARFRKAHESVQSARQEFLHLGRALQQAPGHGPRPTTGQPAANETGDGATTRLPPAEWLGSRAEIPADAGARRAGLGTGSTNEQAGAGPHGHMAVAAEREILRRGAEPSDWFPGRGGRGIPADAPLPTAGDLPGPGGAPEGDIVLRAIEEARNRGLGGDSGPADDMGRSESSGPFADRRQQPGASGQDLDAFQRQGEILADIRLRQGFAGGLGDAGARTGGSGQPERMAREALAGYVEWMTGDREVSRDRVAAAQHIGTPEAGAQRRDQEALPEATDARHRSGPRPGSLDPREGIRRTRASSPIAAPVDESIAPDRATPPSREMPGASPGEWDAGARLGSSSTDVIVRLLREQNELIRQDLRRTANPPIAAPPPMRGGGARM